MIVMRSYIEPGGLRGGPPGPASPDLVEFAQP